MVPGVYFLFDLRWRVLSTLFLIVNTVIFRYTLLSTFFLNFCYFFFQTIPDKIYFNTTETYKLYKFSNPLPTVSMLKSDKFWKISLSKPTLSSRGKERECGRRNLRNFCLFSIYFVRDCSQFSDYSMFLLCFVLLWHLLPFFCLPSFRICIDDTKYCKHEIDLLLLCDIGAQVEGFHEVRICFLQVVSYFL